MKKNIFVQFIKQYSLLSLLALASAIIAVAYVFLNEAFASLPRLAELFSLVNTLGLAIIANFVFCFFQVFIPEVQEREKVCASVKSGIEKILTSISQPFEQVHFKKKGKHIPLDQIPDTEIADLLCEVNLTDECGLNGISPNGKLFSPPINWMLYTYVLKSREEIERLINLLGKYMDSELISLLLDIHRCAYFGQIIQFHNSGVLNKMSGWCHDENLSSLKHLYTALKECEKNMLKEPKRTSN